MINSKQRSYLRSMAHDLDPVAYIGKFTLYRESKENKQIVLPRQKSMQKCFTKMIELCYNN